MRKFAILLAVGVLLLGLPAFADSWTTFANPAGDYLTYTTNYGGGDGSGGVITSLGTFQFSIPMAEFNVPNSWATWNCPPFTESCFPNVLYSQGATGMTLTLTAHDNIAGFELEPDQFQQELVQAIFHSSTGDAFTLSLMPNGSAGALLFAAEDTTPGAYITSIDIVDTAGDDFAIAQLRQGHSPTPATPEPGTMMLFGGGLLGAIGVIRRKLNL